MTTETDRETAAGAPAETHKRFRLFARPVRNGELRLLAPYDARAFLAMVDSDREHFETWLPWAREIRTADDARTFIARGTSRFAEFGTPWVAIWVEDVLVGGVLFWPIDDMGRHVELGYWLARRAGGRGLMTDAVATLLDFCFEELDLNKVVIKCAAGNTASRGVPRRLGFAEEGLLREHVILDGTAHDLVVYGMLRRDWANSRPR
jgi:ribosomal-protein-serine acetyltransferase